MRRRRHAGQADGINVVRAVLRVVGTGCIVVAGDAELCCSGEIGCRRLARLDTFDWIATAAEGLGAAVERDPLRYRLTINGELTLLITASRCFNSDAGGHRWNISFDTRLAWDLMLVARMNHENDGIQDYYVLPRAAKWPDQIRIREENDFSLECFRMGSLEKVMNLIQRSTLMQAPNERSS